MSTFPYCNAKATVWSVCGWGLVEAATPGPGQTDLILGLGEGHTCCTLSHQRGEQVKPARESNQSDLGQVRLLKPALIHTHTPPAYLCLRNRPLVYSIYILQVQMQRFYL